MSQRTPQPPRRDRVRSPQHDESDELIAGESLNGAEDSSSAHAASPDADADDDAADDDEQQGSRVTVLVRVRPLLAHETQAGHANKLLQLPAERGGSGGGDSHIRVQAGDAVHRFSFDAVLGPQHGQEDVYRAGKVERMLHKLLQGYHATIFAYGQTGSGKTHTMDGISYATKQVAVPAGTPVTVDGEPAANVKVKTVRVIREPSAAESGLSLRCINELFALIESRQSSAAPDPLGPVRYTVRCSFIQVYQESVYDLLAEAEPHYVSRADSNFSGKTSSNAGLRIRWSAARNFYVENLYIFECATAKDARSYFLNGMKKRLVASHRMNASSSRSHCIFTLHVEQSRGSGATVGSVGAGMISSQLNLVDLAGSERVALTGATGSVLGESIGINKSLFVLRKVIKALSKLGGAGDNRAKQMVPYRDSVLTRLLQGSLGGSCITLMIACLSSSDAYLDENLSTLNYAGLAKRIANKATMNEDPQSALIRKLKAEVKMLRALLARANNQVFSLEGGASGAGGSPRALAASTHNGHSPYSRPQLTSSASGSGGGNDLSARSTTSSSFGSLPPEVLAEKLVDSVSLIRQLVRDNNDLRSLYDSHASTAEALECSNAALHHENDELRDRVHFLETVIVDGQGEEILKSQQRAHAALTRGPEQGVVVVDDEADQSQQHRDLTFELAAMREENQRLKNMMIASDFSSSRGATASGARSSHSSSGVHQTPPPPPPPSQQHTAAAHSHPAAAAYPSASSSTSAPASRSGVHSSGYGSSSYRANALPPSLTFTSSLQSGRKGRVQSGQRRSTAPHTRQQQQQQQPPQSHHSTAHYPQPYAHQPYSVPPSTSRAAAPPPSYGRESPPSDDAWMPSPSPTAAATSAAPSRPMHAWDGPPQSQQQYQQSQQRPQQQAYSAAPPTTRAAPSPQTSSLYPTALSSQPIALQLGAPSWANLPTAPAGTGLSSSFSDAAAANPAIAAFMRRMAPAQTPR